MYIALHIYIYSIIYIALYIYIYSIIYIYNIYIYTYYIYKHTVKYRHTTSHLPKKEKN